MTTHNYDPLNHISDTFIEFSSNHKDSFVSKSGYFCNFTNKDMDTSNLLLDSQQLNRKNRNETKSSAFMTENSYRSVMEQFSNDAVLVADECTNDINTINPNMRFKSLKNKENRDRENIYTRRSGLTNNLLLNESSFLRNFRVSMVNTNQSGNSSKVFSNFSNETEEILPNFAFELDSNIQGNHETNMNERLHTEPNIPSFKFEKNVQKQQSCLQHTEFCLTCNKNTSFKTVIRQKSSSLWSTINLFFQAIRSCSGKSLKKHQEVSHFCQTCGTVISKNYGS